MAEDILGNILDAIERIKKQEPIVLCSPAMADKLAERKGELPPHKVQASKFVADDTVYVWRPGSPQAVVK